jgi:hypothetical protein
LPATSYIASDASHPVQAGSVSLANADTLKKLSEFLQTKYGYGYRRFSGI